MCENRGADFRATQERAAHLVAYLCASKKIPETNLRMHWHWGQASLKAGRPPYHKGCPHSFLDASPGGGFIPNKHWTEFQSKVHLYVSKLENQ
jgi:N-acetylmuramoyl-L-alanine amidase CwlA